MTYILRLGVGMLLSLGCVSAASAHAHLKSAEPAENATVASPAALTLHFTEGLEAALSGIAVTGRGQTQVELGDAQTAAGDDTTLVVPVKTPMEPGVYTVDWHALAKDGHKSKGSYTFTVKP